MTDREARLAAALQELHTFTVSVIDRHVDPETLAPLWETVDAGYWQVLDGTVSDLLHKEGTYE